ncbi:MAG: ABC transporter substrate-binding protein [Actinomycetota bacterium]
MPLRSRSSCSAARPGARRVAGLALAVALAAGGCTPSEDAVPRPTEPPERPPLAGSLRLGYPEEPVNLNPIRAGSAAPRDILRAVLPSFFVVSPDLRYRPYLLAEEPEVDVSGDRMTVSFVIQAEARWSDGRPVTVDDVEFTWRVMTDPRLPVAIRDGFDHLVAVRESSDKEGSLVLSPPFARWRDLFSAGRFVLPAHAGTRREVAGWNRGPPVSAGPFRLGPWVGGRSITLVADPSFWGPRPLLRRVEVAFVPDPTTAILLLREGRLDAVAPMPGVSWGRRLAAIPGVEVSEAYGPELVHLAINTEELARARLRRRIADAVGRDRFVEVLLRGEGRKADGALAPEQAGANPAWARYGRGGRVDVGVEDELTLAYPRGEILDLLAKYVRAELGRSGVDVELVSLDAEIFHHTWLPERRFDLALWRVRSGPSSWLSRWFGSSGGESATGLRDRALDALLARADRGGEDGARALRQAQERLAGLAPVLPLFQPQVTVAWRPGVGGLRANPTVDGVLWNAWNWSVTEEADLAA